ncbi:hypothetical protein [Nocardioides sp.]|uniref:hypothetical protein n=1 Tax=Nocardioides sp. TaxID=35761 RepID=UPI002B275BE6|nr:hypothetical protein [Nocardioides sp.]
MSTPSTTPSSRTSLIAAGGGAVALALLVGFAVGLPEITGDGHSGPGVEELAPLPDTLPGDLISLLGTEVPDEVLAQFGGTEQLEPLVDSASDNLATLFGDPTAFGLYTKVDGSAFLTVTVAPGEPGLFVPDGAPFDADVQGAARGNLEVVRVDDDTVCSVVYAAAIAEGQPVDPAEQPSRTHCQLGSEGLLYDVTGQGVGVDEVVIAAEAVRDLQES